MLQQAWQLGQLQAFARIHQQRGALQVAFPGGMQFRENRNQFHGQIVDAVVAHVLEGFKDGAFPRTGKTGEDDELSTRILRRAWIAFAALGALHGFAALSS